MQASAELVRGFVNTYDVESGADELSSPAELTACPGEHGLTGPRDRATDDDLGTAPALREGLRGCADRSCQRSFVDSSKNRSRSWWSMRVCGKRTKTRAYRARKQGSRRLQASNTDTV